MKNSIMYVTQQYSHIYIVRDASGLAPLHRLFTINVGTSGLHKLPSYVACSDTTTDRVQDLTVEHNTLRYRITIYTISLR
jgi:hypothetical protein